MLTSGSGVLVLFCSFVPSAFFSLRSFNLSLSVLFPVRSLELLAFRKQKLGSDTRWLSSIRPDSRSKRWFLAILVARCGNKDSSVSALRRPLVVCGEKCGGPAGFARL